MLRKVFLLIGSLLLVVWLNGQCPDRDSLWREISLLKDSLDKSDNPKALALETRQQLLQWEKKIQYCPYWNDSTHVLLLRTIGTTYFKQGNYLEVIRCLNEAAALIRRTPNNPAVNEKELMRIYLWMAYAYKLMNNVRERMKIADSCIKECRRFNYVDRSIQNPLFERGQYFYDLGDYHHAIAYFKECEEKAVLHFPHAVDKEDSSGTMTYALSSFGWRINALFRLKQYNEAEALLNSQVNKHGANILSAYRGTFYGLQAETEIHKGNYTRSLQFFKQALAVEKRPLSRKQLLNTMANEVYFRQYRQYDKALSLFREALTYVNTDKSKYKEDSIESLNIWSNMAEIYVQKGSYDTAFTCFRRALNHIRERAGVEQLVNSPTEDIIRLKKIHYLTGLLIEMGNTLQKKYTYSRNTGDLQEAIKIFKYADQLVNRIKGEQSNLNSKLFWRNDSHGLYEHALDACYTAGKPADAFYFFEKSRAVLLNDQLADQRWLGEQDILQQAQARMRVNALERELKEKKLSASARAELEQEKAMHQQLLEQLTSKIKERNPFYYQNFIDSNFISLQQVQQTILKDYQAFIELFSGDSAVYVMIITAGNARLRKIDKQAFDSLAGRFITYVSDYDQQNSDFGTFTHISNSLYQLIFQQEAIPAGRVIISPDGRYFPFEALLTTTRPRTWFLKDHAISYTYSARYLFNDFTAATNKQAKTFMGFAPVQYAGAKLPELYESDRSLEALTRYFSTADNFTGKEASRNNFLQQFANYRIIQLYTHASDNLEQGEPVIYFADSLLYLSDLVSDKKPATSLVVLSACETGLGKFYQGEGVFSFNRGFAALGIPAAITSLWKAQNKKTYTLTTLFYKYLSEGEPADVALQHAKLEFMESSQENGLPYHWAVPVLTGKITDMPGQPFPWWLVLPAIAAGMIVLLLVVRWWRSAYHSTR